jgi:dTDP-glucose 4,6-dehydratase
MQTLKALPSEDLEKIVSAVGNLLCRLKNQHLFITGGTGLIGKWLLESLLYANQRLNLNVGISVLTRNPRKFKSESICAKYVNVIVGDIRSFQLPALERVNYVIHGATDVVSPCNHADVLETCTLGTANLLSQAHEHGASRVLMLSSGAVYGKTPSELTEIPESYLGPIDFRSVDAAYGEGKRCAELMCALASGSSGMVIPVARCFAMIGPHMPLDKHFAIGNFIGAALRSEPILIEGDGTPVRSYLYMSDVIMRLLILLLDGESDVYNVGGRTPISIKDLAFKVGSIINPDCPIEIKGKALHGAHANRYIPSVNHFNARWLLPEPVSLEKAILTTADWYK